MMQDTQGNMSDVAALLRQIEEADKGAYDAFYGLRSGNARHEEINACMGRIAGYYEELAGIVGEEKAAGLLTDTMDKVQIAH